MARAQNANTIASVPATDAAVGTEITHVGLWSAVQGGTFLLAVEVDQSNVFPINEDEKYEIDPGVMILEQPIGDEETEDMAEAGLRGRLDRNTYLSFHTEAPGRTGVGESPHFPRVAMSGADWNFIK